MSHNVENPTHITELSTNADRDSDFEEVFTDRTKPKKTPSLPTGSRRVQICDEVCTLSVTPCRRASRAAKANTPSPEAHSRAQAIVVDIEKQLRERGLRLLPGLSDTTARSALVSRAPMRASSTKSERTSPSTRRGQHLSTVHRNDLHVYNLEVSWLMAGRTAPMTYDRALEAGLRANAVGAAVLKRADTQGAAYQTTRVNCRLIGNAAAAQLSVVALTVALSEACLRRKGRRVVDPKATNALDPCLLACLHTKECALVEQSRLAASVADGRCTLEEARLDSLLPILSTEWLVYNARPSKLGSECIKTAACTLARLERDRQLLSARTGSPMHMVKHLCNAVEGGYVTDPTWASIVLIVYVCCDARTRGLIAHFTDLTDVDVQTAFALEVYGRGEITRRVRLRVQQARKKLQIKCPKRRRRSMMPVRAPGEPEQSPSVEDDTASVVHDSGEEFALDDECAAELDGLFGGEMVDEERRRVLSTKRRRVPKGSSTGHAMDSYTLLSWWHAALRCPTSSVCCTLVSDSELRTREASDLTLQRQAADVGASTSAVLEAKAASNALRSQEHLGRFVQRYPIEAPRWIRVRTADGPAIGLLRVPTVGLDERGRLGSMAAGLPPPVTIHACLLAPAACQPPAHVPITLLWSETSQPVRSSTECVAVPNVLEACAALHVCSAQSNSRLHRSLRWHVHTNTIPAVTSTASGAARSVVCIAARVATRASTFDCAYALADEGAALADRPLHGGPRGALRGLCAVEDVGDVAEVGARREPSCTPASPLAVGIARSEVVRRMLARRTRHNYTARVSIESVPTEEVLKDPPPVMDSEPLPMIVITNLDMRCSEDEHSGRIALQRPDRSDPGTEGRRTHDLPGTAEYHVPTRIALHIALDGAVRAPEIIAALRTSGTQVHATRLQRGVLYAGASQASYLSELMGSIGASCANSAINSSKKISVADVNTVALLSIWDVYGGGLSNMRPCFAGTAYCGSYGPPLDTGITSVGLSGHYVCSDKRGHGNMYMSTAVADRLALRLAHSRHVPSHDGKSYAATPAAVRGIPHVFYNRVHSVLDATVEALDHFFTPLDADRRAGPSTKGLFSMPFSAFTQALAPDVECTADPTVRQCIRDPSQESVASGRSYLSDATSEHEALLTEPLWRRPCQSSVVDNPFTTSYEHADGLFNALNTLAVVARECGGVAALYHALDQWHSDVDVESMHFQWAADACILMFGGIYPSTHYIDECVVPDCYARACARVAKHVAKYGCGITLRAALHDEPTLVSQATTLWSNFRRKESSLCPWRTALAPFLESVLLKSGSHDTSQQELETFRQQLARVATVGAWYISESVDHVCARFCTRLHIHG